MDQSPIASPRPLHGAFYARARAAIAISVFLSISRAAFPQATTSTARHLAECPAVLTGACSVASRDVCFRSTGTASARGAYQCVAGNYVQMVATGGTGVTGSGTVNQFARWAAATDIGGSILSQGTNSVEQRNGTSAQQFSVYNTYTDASNYERLNLKWSSNIAKFQPEYLGTGQRRVFEIHGADGSGTNVAGSELQLYGGASTGTALGGGITFFVTPPAASGSSLNTPLPALALLPDFTIALGNVTQTPDKGFLFVGSSGVLTGTPAATNGQVLIGQTGSNPVPATITAGSGITVTNGPGSVTIAASGGGTAPIIEASSKVPVTPNLVFENVFIGSGSGWKHFRDLGIADATTLNADATWALLYHMPPALPTGTATFRLRCISALSSGVLKFNPKWNVCGTAEDCSSVTLNAEGTQTVTYSVAGAFVEVDTTLDASTVTPGKDLIMNLVFENTGTTAAGTSTCSALVVFLP